MVLNTTYDVKPQFFRGCVHTSRLMAHEWAIEIFIYNHYKHPITSSFWVFMFSLNHFLLAFLRRALLLGNWNKKENFTYLTSSWYQRNGVKKIHQNLHMNEEIVSNHKWKALLPNFTSCIKITLSKNISYLEMTEKYVTN